MKTPFVTKEQLEAIVAQYPTPFHIYDEKGIRENARALKAAFSWNPGYREYFAVKATPTPAILKILNEEGCGCDCSSDAELLMSEKCGITGESIMFSSNETPAYEYQMAHRMGAIINLDDITHVEYREQAIGKIRASAHHFYAGRWAAKEAASKALGCGIGSECAFNEIEVVDSPIGVPSLVFSGSAARTAAALGAKNIRVSITHEREYAAAVVIIEE